MSRRQGIMLAYPFTETRMDKWLREGKPLIVQPKYNGTRLMWTGTHLKSSEGNEVKCLPHILEECKEKFANRPLDGEAYCHGMSLQNIRAITGRSKNLHENYLDIDFVVFDKPIPKVPQATRIASLLSEEETDYIKIAPSVLVRTVKAATGFLQEVVDSGYEGVVIRRYNGLWAPKRSVDMVKWKPKRKDAYRLVEMVEGTGKYEGTLGAFIVEDPEGHRFHVGSFAITDIERDRLWRNSGDLLGRWVVVRYFELTDSNIPPSGVFECFVEKGDMEDA